MSLGTGLGRDRPDICCFKSIILGNKSQVDKSRKRKGGLVGASRETAMPSGYGFFFGTRVKLEYAGVLSSNAKGVTWVPSELSIWNRTVLTPRPMSRVLSCLSSSSNFTLPLLSLKLTFPPVRFRTANERAPASSTPITIGSSAFEAELTEVVALVVPPRARNWWTGAGVLAGGVTAGAGADLAVAGGAFWAVAPGEGRKGFRAEPSVAQPTSVKAAARATTRDRASFFMVLSFRHAITVTRNGELQSSGLLVNCVDRTGRNYSTL